MIDPRSSAAVEYIRPSLHLLQRPLEHSGAELLDGKWGATYAAVSRLADGAIELDGDGPGAAPDLCGRQSCR